MNNDVLAMQSMALEDMWPLVEDVFKKGGRFRLFPRGKSMLPLIRPGVDSVLIEPPSEFKKRDILLYRRTNGQFVLHRLMRIEKTGLVMCGDNQVYLERYVPQDAVLARVCGIYFGDEYCPIDSKKLLFYAKRRTLSRPFRRAFSAVKRRIT